MSLTINSRQVMQSNERPTEPQSHRLVRTIIVVASLSGSTLLTTKTASADPFTCVGARKPDANRAEVLQRLIEPLLAAYHCVSQGSCADLEAFCKNGDEKACKDREDIRKKSVIALDFLQRMYSAFPLPSVGSELAAQYLGRGRLSEARAILTEVAAQRPDRWPLDKADREGHEAAKVPAICALKLWQEDRVSPQGVSADLVTKALEECFKKKVPQVMPPTDTDHPLLVVEVEGAESNLRVWFDQEDDQHACATPSAPSSSLQLSAGKHRIFWKDSLLDGTNRGGSCGGITLSTSEPLKVSVTTCKPGAHGEQAMEGQTLVDRALKPSQSRDVARTDWFGWGTFIGGLALGAAGGVTALVCSRQETDHRNKAAPYCTEKGCLPEGADQMETALDWRDWKRAGYSALGVGTVLAGVGVIKLLWFPRSNPIAAEHSTDRSWRVAPTITSNTAGLLVRGIF